MAIEIKVESWKESGIKYFRILDFHAIDYNLLPDEYKKGDAVWTIVDDNYSYKIIALRSPNKLPKFNSNGIFYQNVRIYDHNNKKFYITRIEKGDILKEKDFRKMVHFIKKAGKRLSEIKNRSYIETIKI